MTSARDEALEAWYSQLPLEGGYDSRCDLRLPGAFRRKRVLNLGCRRGKGVCKISDAVGPEGRAVGVDWRPEFIEAAKAGEAKAVRRNGLAQSNMRFLVSYPERLLESGLEPASFDVVFVNSVLNLFYDPRLALEHVGGMLKPGGILVCQGVLATRPRDEEVCERARRLGNAVQAAPERKRFASWLSAAGFNMISFVNSDERRIEVTAGVDAAAEAPFVESDERVGFVSGLFQVCKDDHVDYHAQELKKDISAFR